MAMLREPLATGCLRSPFCVRCVAGVGHHSFVAIKIAAERFDAVAIAAVRVGIAAACLVLFCLLKRDIFIQKRVCYPACVDRDLWPNRSLRLSWDRRHPRQQRRFGRHDGIAPLATLLIGRLCVSGENWTTTKWIALLVGFSGLSLSVNGSHFRMGDDPGNADGRASGKTLRLGRGRGMRVWSGHGETGIRGYPSLAPALSRCLFRQRFLEASGSPPEPRLTRAMNGPGSRLSVSEWSIPHGLWPPYRLIAFAGATFASLNNYLVPLVGLLAGYAILDERFGMGTMVGLVLVLFGILLFSRSAGALRRGARP